MQKVEQTKNLSACDTHFRIPYPSNRPKKFFWGGVGGFWGYVTYFLILRGCLPVAEPVDEVVDQFSESQVLVISNDCLDRESWDVGEDFGELSDFFLRDWVQFD